MLASWLLRGGTDPTHCHQITCGVAQGQLLESLDSIVAIIAISVYVPAMATLTEPRLPSTPEVDAARAALEQLRDLHPGSAPASIQLRASEDGAEAVVNLPRAAFDLLIDMLSQLASGHAVTVVPVHAELTTQQAADLLNVSRPFLISLLESGQVPFHRVGNHRRVRFQDLMQYRRQQVADSKVAMTALAAEAERLKLGY